MFRNYLIVALRNIMRQKLYAFINIFGLALGLACCLLMLLYIKHEWSHDQFHEHKDRIFRLVTHEVRPNGDILRRPLLPPEVSVTAQDELPGVVQTTGYIRSRGRIALGEKISRERLGLVDANFLTMFTFPLLVGDPSTALSRPDGIVITESVARNFFDVPNTEYTHLLGQSLTFPDQNLTFVITGVAEPILSVSSMKFNALIPIVHKDKFGHSVVMNAEMSVYLQLTDRQAVKDVQQALIPFAARHMGEYSSTLKQYHHLKDSEDTVSLFLQPLTDIYWNTDVRYGSQSRGNPTDVYILSGIALLVLLIACSNFMTLSIGRSSGRAREVGLRKIVGARRGQLMRQFWSEAIILAFLSLVMGIAIAELFLPIFNGLIQKQLHIAYFEDGLFLLITVCLMVIVGLVAGSYPALALSRLQPVDALKGQTQIGRSNITRTLIILQYAISITIVHDKT